MDTKSRVMEAIHRAVASSQSSGKRLHVCVKSPDDPENIMSFVLGSYQDVRKLADEMRPLGYELSLLDPVMKHCDFVLEPRGLMPLAS